MSGFDNLIKPEAKSVTYGKYLKVHELLTLQQELSSPKEHDETLFIIIHQTYELWFKQILHEMDRIESELSQDQLGGAFRAMQRIITIQKVLNQQVEILETMTPEDFNRFRNHLNPASGFQSHQFRIMEFRLGLKNTSYLNFYTHEPEARLKLEAALAAPTIYDAFLHYLARQGFAIPKAVLERDVSTVYESNADIVALFKTIYQKPDAHFLLHALLESFVDLDEFLVLWRFRHVQMVKRMIGERTGTGGSTGAQYLQMTLSKTAFPDLQNVRNHIGKGY